MAEFKVVVSDTQTGKSYNVEVSGHHANSLIGKRIDDEVDGIFISLPGYKLQITGGTNKDGFPMRRDFPGISRRRLLLSKSLGFKPKDYPGKRMKKSVRGNTITHDIVQVNMKVTKASAKSIESILNAGDEEEAAQE